MEEETKQISNRLKSIEGHVRGVAKMVENEAYCIDIVNQVCSALTEAHGAGMILVPGVPLLEIILFSQVLNGLLLPAILVFMAILVNRTSLMGDRANGPLWNAVVWSTTAALVLLALGLAATGLLPGAEFGF